MGEEENVPPDALSEPEADQPETAPLATQGEGEIVITGSRIRQDSFNSPTPIQVLDAEQAFQLGVSSATELLQRSTVASGQQIDATINTNAGNSNASEAPPTGGTGSSNIDLRGLGIERTLVLVNGRRLGSAGVRGAPSQPDIGLLPLGMIERIDVVTEGASSIYGADAVAGVVNVILRDEFDGLELFGNIERSEHGGGDIEQISATIGTSGGRARIMAGLEYFNRSRISGADRDFTAGGLRVIEEGEDGTIYTLDSPRNGFFDNALNLADGSFVLYTPGQSDTGVPNFSTQPIGALPANARDYCTSLGPAFCWVNFVYFPFYSDNDERLRADLVQPLERYSFVTNGSYDLDYDNDIKAYFEAYFFNREQEVRGSAEQIYMDIPAEIPVLGDDGRFTGDYVDNPLNPFDQDLSPIITLDDLPQTFFVDVQQIRGVLGIQGDMPGEWFRDRRWQFDVSVSYDKGEGFQSQKIIFEPHLYNVTQGLYQREDGTLGCTPVDRTGVNGFFSLNECPIVDFFADNIYTGGPNGDGAFANDAEREYLLGNRTNRTILEQTLYAAYINGDLFDFSWGGGASFAAGYEHRNDKITSQNDIVGVLGLNAAENALVEGETIGSRNLDEVYGELQLILAEDRPAIDLLQIDGAIRYTHESNFGGEETYRLRAMYRPVNWIQLSGSYGTSYRAPNLREQFLADQGGGISGGLDPCINANIQTAIGLSGENDPNLQALIANCVAAGVDFTDTNGNGILDTTTLGTAGITTIPTSTGGNSNLLPETSRSYTATLSVSPPIFTGTDIDLAVSYYDIQIENSVNNLDASIVINRCYNDLNFPNLTSPFCANVSRRTGGNNSSRLLTNVTAGFINSGIETVRGLDFNARVRSNLGGLGWESADLFLAGTASYLLERDQQRITSEPVRDLVGTIGFPEWKMQFTGGLEAGPVTFLTQLNYIGKQTSICYQDLDGNGPACPFNTNFFYAFADGTRPISRQFGRVPAQWYQDVSLTYEFSNDLSLTAGINNLWDNEPPLIDRVAGPNRLNAVASSGYDFIGRTFFLNARFGL